MEVDQIQYFQIISDDQQNENIIYVAYNNDELDVDDSQTSQNLNVKEEENETTYDDKSKTKRESSDLEVVTLSDGSTAYICRDILDINEFLETGIEDDIQNNFENLQPDTEAHPEILVDDKHYQQVQLEDGSIAILEVKVLNPNTELSETVRNEFEEVPNDFKSISGSKKKKIYLCVYEGCNKVYTTHHHLKVHNRTHTGYRPYKCSEVGCEKFFTTKSSLKSHFRTHSNEKPYSCSTCPKSFKTSSDLQKHVRTHTGERPFRCLMDGCSMSFTTSNIRKVHMRTHTGERPFQCPEPNCNKAFASHTNYKNHLRVHSGEKPFVCKEPMCQKRFTEYSSLYKHQVVHRKNIEHVCTVCNKTYRQLTTLKTHMRMVHGINIKNEGTSAALSTNEKVVPVSLVQVTSDGEFNNLSQVKIKDISNNQSLVNFENDQKYDLVFMLEPQ